MNLTSRNRDPMYVCLVLSTCILSRDWRRPNFPTISQHITLYYRGFIYLKIWHKLIDIHALRKVPILLRRGARQIRINSVVCCLWCQTSSSELSVCWWSVPNWRLGTCKFYDDRWSGSRVIHVTCKILKPCTYPASPHQHRMTNWYIQAMLKRLFSTSWPLGDTAVISNM